MPYFETRYVFSTKKGFDSMKKQTHFQWQGATTLMVASSVAILSSTGCGSSNSSSSVSLSGIISTASSARTSFMAELPSTNYRALTDASTTHIENLMSIINHGSPGVTELSAAGSLVTCTAQT